MVVTLAIATRLCKLFWTELRGVPSLTTFFTNQIWAVFDVVGSLAIHAGILPIGTILRFVAPSHAGSTFGLGWLVFAISSKVRLFTNETGDLGVVGTHQGKVSFLLTLFAKQIWTLAHVVVVLANFANLNLDLLLGLSCWVDSNRNLATKMGQHVLD
jgi:hypothetical protein